MAVTLGISLSTSVPTVLIHLTLTIKDTVFITKITASKETSEVSVRSANKVMLSMLATVRSNLML